METKWSFDAALDTEFLQSIYGDDIEQVSWVFAEFLNTAPTMMKEADAFFKAGNVENFRQRIHKIKPVFSYVGLTHLTNQAELIEQQCKVSNGTGGIEQKYGELKTNYEKNFSIIENELKRIENHK